MEIPMQIMLPENLETMQLPAPESVLFYHNRDNRTFWIDYDIDVSVLDIAKWIIQINREDAGIPVEQRKPIRLLIFSYGGDGAACFSLLDTIAMSKTPVYTYNMGIAMSAGFLILLAGHKRFCTLRSTALAHSGSGGTSGSYESTEAQMKDYKHFVQAMRDYIIERTNIDTKLMNKKKSQEWYIYAEEQVQLGICDKIINSIDDIL